MKIPARYSSTILTPEQEAAARPHIGLKSVVATAGAGKTTTSAMSIAAKIHGDLGAEIERDCDIMATTFTKAAANELRRKITDLVGRETEVIVGTIHSFCFDLLKFNAVSIGFPKTIQNIKESERRSRLLSILETSLISQGIPFDKYSYTDLQSATTIVGISQVSPHPEDLGRLAGWKCPPPLIKAAEDYYAYQRVAGFVDFDTMLVFAYKILKTIVDRADAEAKGIHIPRHIYVDEAQDLSAVQWCIVQELGRLAISLTVVGDDDQAIYGWRGATPWRFKKFFEDANVQCLLTSNRRCPQDIVTVGEAIVSNITLANRIPKTLKSSKPSQSGKIIALVGDDRERVAAKVMEIIKGAVQENKLKYSDVLIVYRNTTRVVDEYSKSLTMAEIPYKVLGGSDPMDSDEMQLLRYSLLVASAGNWYRKNEPIASWLGLIEAIGVSSPAAEKIVDQAMLTGGSPASIVESITSSRIAEHSKAKLLAIVGLISERRQLPGPVLVGHISTSEVIQQSLLSSIERAADKRIKSLVAQRKVEKKEAQAARDRDVEARMASTELFLSCHLNLTAAEMAKKLSGVSATSEKPEESTNEVTLSTAHSCKGLEFSTVFIVDPFEDTWPAPSSTRGLKTKTEAVLQDVEDEEMRLMYVAVTRARQNLVFVCPVRNKSEQLRSPSPFLSTDLQRQLTSLFENCDPVSVGQHLLKINREPT